MFEIAKNAIKKNLNGYIVIVVVTNFCKNFSIKVSWYFRKYFSAQNNSSLQYTYIPPVGETNLLTSLTSAT